jgi:fluoride exporter
LLKLLLLGIAGGIGTLARYWLSGLTHRSARWTFPLGTLAVNVLGCVLIGLVMQLVQDRQVLRPETRTFIVVGLLGGFTTFSAFGYETFELMRGGSFLLAGANIAGNVVVGIGAVWLGTVAGRLL